MFFSLVVFSFFKSNVSFFCSVASFFLVDASTVTILGGGIVGSNAAKLAAGLGAKVYILDVNMDRLRYLDDVMPSNVQTMYSNEHNITSLLKYKPLSSKFE